MKQIENLQRKSDTGGQSVRAHDETRILRFKQVAALVGLWRWAAPRLRGAAERFPPVSRGVVLAFALALAAAPPIA